MPLSGSIIQEITANMKKETLTNHDGNRLQAEKREYLSLLARGIAHDFNNFLAAILGNISIIMRNTPSDSPLLKNASQIETTARRALNFTNQLQACAGKGEFHITNIHINGIIEEIAPKLKESVHAGIKIQHVLQKDLPMIKGDQTCIRQIIINLINNASDAILDSTGTINISTGAMKSSLIRDKEICLDEIPQGNNCVYVEIRDSGCGMTPDVQHKIFDPFFTTKLRRHGLGLSIAMGFVCAHGGAIEVNSTPGKGSTFRVMFPAVDQT